MILNRLFRNARRTTPNEVGPRIVRVPVMQAGMHIDHDTALRFSAVHACVRVIAEPIAYMPSPVFTRDGNRRERVDTDPAYKVLNVRPNPEMTPFTFKETLMSWALTWGNGYAEIERDTGGRVFALWPIAPDRVEVTRTRDGRLVYEVSNRAGANDVFNPSDIFHLRGMGFDGTCGYSVISYAARSIGVGLASEEYASSFFSNGTVLSGILEHPGTLSDKAHERLRESWASRHQGPGKAHNPAVLEEGLKWKQISLPPEDAQLVETQKFSVNVIARWFRVPPHKIGDLERATFTNIEHQSIEFVTDTILPWVTRFEQEANFKLLSSRYPRFVKFNLNTLLRGDSESRSKFYKQMFDMGVYSPNDIRELEDENPIPDGDKRFVQLNLTTLEKAGTEMKVPEPQVEPEDPVIAAHKAVLAYVIKDCLRREESRIKDVLANSTKSDLASCVDKFFATDQRRHMIQTITPAVLDAAKSITDIPEGQLLVLVAEYADEHLQESRDGLLGAGLSYEERAKRDAGMLLDRIRRIAENSRAAA